MADMLATALTWLVCAAPAPQEPFSFDEAWSHVQETLHRECERHRVVGGSVMFLRKDDVLGHRELGFAAHGMADRSGGRKVDRQTIFHWASCTKTLTGIAIMQLRDRGMLQLDQPIVDHVPELRDVRNPFGEMTDITIEQLMSHSAGFRGATWPWGGDQPWHPHEPTQWSQLVAMLPYTTIGFEPGSKFSYSNPGIVFLGRTIEKLTGDDYEVYVDKNVLRPLRMHHTYFDVTPYHLRRHRSHSYRTSGQQVVDHGPDFDTGITVSNGGLNAPMTDMAHYLGFLLGGFAEDGVERAVLQRSSLDEMWRPRHPTSRSGGERIGLTFFLQEHGGTRFATHTGGQQDFVTFFYVHPASGTAALGAFNSSTGGPVMAAIRKLCMQTLSVPMAKR
jgi:CubicO group peptidase (beta-lactamase class C family)